MGHDIRTSVYIEFTPKSTDKKFLEDWFSDLVEYYGVVDSDIETNIAYDSKIDDERSIISFDMYSRNGVDYSHIQEFVNRFENYDNLLVTCNEWVSSDDGFFFEKINGEIQ